MGKWLGDERMDWMTRKGIEWWGLGLLGDGQVVWMLGKEVHTRLKAIG